MSLTMNSRYWVPNETEGYVQGTYSGASDGKANFVSENGRSTFDIPEKQAVGLGLITDEQLVGVDNITDLTTISEGALLSTVKVRYLRDDIYTCVARIVLALNPFRQLRIYDAAHIEKYSTGGSKDPHVFGVAADAFSGLMNNRIAQAVLISGESGAGKTESTKHVLGYLADVAGSSELAIENKILSTNPILEAFGNAKTVRNNNSSRFGKWMQVVFLKKMEIEGAQVTDYLLETTRIISQGKLERNYHIFYQILSNANTYKKECGLKTPKDYEFLKYSMAEAPKGIDDDADWTDTKQSFDTIGFPPEMVRELVYYAAGILTMGNLAFKPDKTGEGSEIANGECLNEAAKLLGLDAHKEALGKCCITKKLTIGKEVTVKLLSAEAAASAKDAALKLMYLLLFKDLICFINHTLAGKDQKIDKNYIGVLDIAGFESFETNSLEQLFINLSNETLQMYFNDFVFKSELEDYKAEDIPVDDITFRDNADILELVAGKGGLLDMLDEELNVGKATNETYVNKVVKKHEKHSRFTKNRFGKACYTIQHFAGQVEYDCAGWLEKNLDDPPKDLGELMANSTNKKLNEIGARLLKEIEAKGKAGGRGKATVSKAFRASLKKLIDEVGSCEPHFIRCIKPNAAKEPKIFEGKSVMEQLLYSGAMEAVKIRQAGYPYRIKFDEFCKRYFSVIPMKTRAAVYKEITKKDANPQDTLKTNLVPVLCTREGMQVFASYLPQICGKRNAVETKDFRIGKTKMFMKIPAQNSLTTQLALAQAEYALTVQRFYRGFVARKMMRAIKKSQTEQKEFLKKADSVYGFYFDALSVDYRVNDPAKIAEKEKAKPPQSGLTIMGGGDLAKLAAEKENLTTMVFTARRLKIVPKSTRVVEEIASKAAQEVTLHEYMKSGKCETTEDVAELNTHIGVLATLSMGDLQKTWTDLLTARKQKVQTQMPIVEFLGAFGGTQDAQKLGELFEDVGKLPNFVEDESYKNEDFWLRAGMAEQLLELKKRLASLQPKASDGAPAAPAPTQGRRGTLVASEMDVMKIMNGLEQALMTFDYDKLSDGVSNGTKKGIKAEDMAKYDEMCGKLQDQNFVLKSLQENVEVLKKADDEDPQKTLAMAKVHNLITRAKGVGVPQESIDAAQMILTGAAQMAPAGDGGPKKFTIFFDNDIASPLTAEESVAMGTFGDLYNYSRLRERKPLIDPETGRDTFLDHSSQKIKAAMLIDVPSKHQQSVLQCFRNVLGWMNDRPVQDQKRVVLAFTIVAVAKAEIEIRNEIYIQVMKQLRKNPNARSEMLGWKLLLLLCQQCVPCQDLLDFVVAFLKQSYLQNKLDESRLEYAHLASDCFKAIQKSLENCDKRDLDNLGYTATAAANAAAAKTNSQANTVKIEVFLMDNSSRKLRCRRHTTIQELSNKVTELLKMSSEMIPNYGFFQLVDDVVETHRVIPENVTLGELSDKWAGLFKKTGKQSRLLYKRLFLTKTEGINPSDLVGAEHTFRQSYFEYLRYPVGESFGDPQVKHRIYSIACALLSVDIDTWRPFLSSPAKLKGILERLIPTVYMMMAAKKHGPMDDAARAPEIKAFQEMIDINVMAETTSKTRRNDFKNSKLVVPPLVNDPLHKGLQMVNSKTFAQLQKMDMGDVNPIPRTKKVEVNAAAEKAALTKTQSNTQTSGLLAQANAGIRDMQMSQNPPFVTGDHQAMPSYDEMAADIHALYMKEYEKQDDAGVLRKMESAFQLIQGLSYFGSFFYAVREFEKDQISEKIDSDVPLTNIDTHSTVRNDCFWTCIDLDGVTFLGRAPGEINIKFEKKFYYFTGAAQCLTKWGAKDNTTLVQLREPGRHYVSLFVSKMALDIAYAMFRLSKSAKAAKQ